MKRTITFFKTMMVAMILLVGSTSIWGQTSFTATLGSFSNATKAYAMSYSPATPTYASSPTTFGNSGLTSETTVSSTYATYTGWDVQTRYFYYSITAVAGYNLAITAINSNLRSSNTGPKAIAIETATSLSGTWTQRAISSLSGTTAADVNGTSLSITVNAGQTLYIRYRNTSTVSANNGTVATTGTGRINSGSIVGTYTIIDGISAPSTQASAINFTSIGQTGMTANWTNGDGAKRVVIMNTSNSFTDPTDSTDPTANTVYSGSGEQVVYNGTGTSVAVTGLTAATTYYFRVYEYNGSSTTTKYLTTTGTNNPNSQTTNAASTPTISAVGTINAFANTVINATSAEQSYTLQGSNLTGDITVTPPAGFEISKTTGSGFVANPSTITFTPAEVASAQSVYVRFAPTAAQAYSGNITHTSTGATQVDKAVSGTGIKAEPTNHATSFTATANSSSQITVTWTDATGGQAPDGYLIKASTTSPTAPSDGTTETDATLVKNITQGTQTAVFTGLSASTTYNFSIWPNTNSGSSINYKTDGTVPTASAITQDPPSIKWDGGAGTTAWSDATNWSGDAIPGSTDIVVLDNSLVSGNYSVVLPSGSVKTSILKLTISPTLPNIITLTLPTENTYGATNDAGLAVGDNTASTDDIIINDGGILINASGASTGNGIQVNSLTNGTLRINNGGKFVHKTTRSAAGTSAATILSTVSGTEKGIFEYDIPGTSSYTLGASGRTYGSLTLTRSAGAATVSSSGGSDLTIKGDFLINSGVTYSSSMTGAMNVGGNITNNGTALTIPSGQAVNLNGTSTQLISGTNKITLAGTTTIANGATVSIAPTLGLTVTGAFTNNGTITLQSDATGTATLITPSTISGTGTATVQQYLQQGRNWYISAPVSGASASTLSGSGLGTSVAYYNEPGSAWVDNYTGTLTPGVGYVAVSSAGSGTSNAEFTGTLNNGDITVNLTRQGATKTGFNLVANPYPSYLDAKAAISANSNMEQTIWYRTKVAGTYYFETVNTTSGIGSSPVSGTVSRLIPPMQAFWVRTNTDNNSLVFSNTMRYHANPTISGATVTTTNMKAPKQENSDIIRLLVSNGKNSDETVIYSNTNALDGYDQYDSQKMLNNNTEIPDLYSIIDDNKLVINGMSNFNISKEIPLGFAPGKAGVFSISLTAANLSDATMNLVLKDKNDNSETVLSTGESYSFSSDATASSNRFSIIFKNKSITTGTENTSNANKILVYSGDNNTLHLVCNANQIGKLNYKVVNALGQQLWISKATDINMQVTLPVGMYTVQCGDYSTKVIIK